MTNTHNHTPAPWVFSEYKGKMHLISLAPQEGAVNGGFTAHSIVTETDKANARLIAAAPDLLEALETCLKADFNNKQLTDDDRAKFRAIIAKARGQYVA